MKNTRLSLVLRTQIVKHRYVWLCFRCLGASLALCPEYSLVLEDELGVCGCAVGILDVRSFAKRCQATWLPAMRDKYPSLPHGHAATKVRNKNKHSKTKVLLVQ